MRRNEEDSDHTLSYGSLDGGPRYSSSCIPKLETKQDKKEEPLPNRISYKDVGEDNWPPTMGDKIAKICLIVSSTVSLGYFGLFQTIAQHAFERASPVWLRAPTAWLRLLIVVLVFSVFAIPTIILSIIALALQPRYHKGKAIFGLVVGLGFYLAAFITLIIIIVI